jgi:hypothetical protein
LVSGVLLGGVLKQRARQKRPVVLTLALMSLSQRAFLAGKVMVVTLNRTMPMVAHALGRNPRHGLRQ